ncbi:MAG: cation-transporting ATPase [Actinoallomurus sp.]|jgi:copper chaperone|nr:cation-transporting ATPase [Actinoallomurus sp.]
MINTRYEVTGMTCGHCVSAVTEEIGRIDGVTGVDVELATGSVTVTSTATLSREAVREAVDEAGYEIAGS